MNQELTDKTMKNQINDDSSSNDSFIIGRAKGGTSLNGLEYVMKDGDYQMFASLREAMDFLRSFYSSLTDDELKDSFVIKTFNGINDDTANI